MWRARLLLIMWSLRHPIFNKSRNWKPKSLECVGDKMGRKPCCTKQGLNRGTLSAQEDKVLINYIQIHGQGKWRDLPLKAGTWSMIAGRLPGRTDNEIKNYWNTNLSKRKKLEESSIPAEPHRVIRTKAVRCTTVVIIPGPHDCNMTVDHNVGALVQEEDNNSTQLIYFDLKELLSSSGSLQANDHQINENGDRNMADGDHLHHHCCLECSKFSYEAMFEDLMDERTTRLSDPFENNDHMMD
ncbi:hypothetical protein EZV62_012998 [Acer yangbiense]|uniref:Uncharacterized protein n=1 Tax=Acer yangbiense TaxID=1000413 RepID=A0A5C7HXS4_9ROSI|nr:hypothetical protein EZV62_012998 [Acer yangbiense]